MNALRTGFLVLIIGSVPGLSVAQDAGQSAVDFSGCYVGFGDEGIIGHNAARMPPGNPRPRREAQTMSADDFRDLVLELEGAVERAHMGHPDFRANGRIFASLHASEQWGTVKLAPEEQHEFMRTHPEVFAPAAGAWGRQGWTTVQLHAARRSDVRSALLLAWQAALDKPPSRRAPARRTKK